jgi:uncharacterized protein (TIGR01244 family)
MKISYIFLAMLGLLLYGCNKNEPMQKTETTAEMKLQTASLGNTPNVHKFEDFYFAGQPSEADLKEAQKIGIRTVINLRMPQELSYDEEEAVKALGMSYHNLAIGSPDMMTDELFGEIRDILNRSENQPVLLHCGSANRVGAMWLAYRVLESGLSLEDATAEAKTVGLRNPAMEAKAREYIEHQK